MVRLSPAPGSSSVIDELVRVGARRMLAEALQAEVDAYIARFAEDRERTAAGWWCVTAAASRGLVTSCVGVIEVHAPRVNGRRMSMRIPVMRQRPAIGDPATVGARGSQIVQVLAACYTCIGPRAGICRARV